jgi:glycosyltransferase involved in cell wall biosynthesis
VASNYSKLSIVIPFYNSEETILELFRRTNKMAQLNKIRVELILVDDGSQDSTWDVINGLQNTKYVSIHGIKLSRNFGQHPATVAGLRQSTMPWVAIMDCDLQDSPEDLPKLLLALKKEKTEIAHAVDLKPKKFYNLLANLFIHRRNQRNHRIEKNVTTLRIISKKVCRVVLQYPELSKLSGPIIDQVGFKRSYVPCQRMTRLHGTRYSLSNRSKIALVYLVSQSRAFPGVLAISALTSFAAALFYTFYIMYGFFVLKQPLPPGLNQIVILNLLTFAISMLGLSVTVFLLYEVLAFARKRPAYEIEESFTKSST